MLVDTPVGVDAVVPPPPAFTLQSLGKRSLLSMRAELLLLLLLHFLNGKQQLRERERRQEPVAVSRSSRAW